MSDPSPSQRPDSRSETWGDSQGSLAGQSLSGSVASRDTSVASYSLSVLSRIAEEQAHLVKNLSSCAIQSTMEVNKLKEQNDLLQAQHRHLLMQLGSGGEQGRPGLYEQSNSFSSLPPPEDWAIGRSVVIDNITSATSVSGTIASNYSPSERFRVGSQPDSKMYQTPLPEAKRQVESQWSQVWSSFAFLCTALIPNFLIRREGKEAKQAWREKVAIVDIMIFTCAIFFGVFGFVPLYFCRASDIYTFDQIWEQDGAAWSVIYGTIYDMKPYINKHPGGNDGILDFLGHDASKLFPRLPPSKLPSVCLNPNKNITNFENTTCNEFSELDNLVGLPCHDWVVGRDAINYFFGDYEKGILAYAGSELGDSGMKWIQIYNNIYDVTQYVDAMQNNRTLKIEKDHENAYLDEVLNGMILNKLNQDATQVYEDLFSNSIYLDCMDELFYAGVIDDRYDAVCHGLGIGMYGLLIFVAALWVLQAVCSLLYLARKNRTFTKADSQAAVMVMVPCYNEGCDELRKTIDSVLMTEYPEDKKVLVVVADGMVTGKDERCSTPKYLSEILGFEIQEIDQAYEYKSVGAKTVNYASVYAGTHYEKKSGNYKIGAKSLKYIVVVKRGAPEERNSSRPGNRGKRDSQLLMAGVFNRIHHDREPTALDSAINLALNNLAMTMEELQYLMAIDADTRVAPDSIPHMVYSMEADKKILACCGETQVDNKAQSWVTMIQVFEYYSNHHMKKAFESVFGCVTCLPGCFTMYRIFTEDMSPLVTSDPILLNYARNDIESLHEKNLFHLGEDRMLTTLLLKHFPGMRLSFVPEASCWTIVPHTFSILLSQRRRWINSTFHNMWELLKVETMCGICCVSMKMVVICDIIATMILPASLIYAGYFVYLAVTDTQNIDQIVVILYGLMIGVQMLTFIIRARWDFLWWFAMFAILGVPVFYFLLPLYSFWHMDDFSWGTTRQVNTTNINNGEATDSSEEEQVPELSERSNTGAMSNADSDSSSSGEDAIALPVPTPPEASNFPPVQGVRTPRQGSF